MTAALTVFGARHETHLLYALSWARERLATHGAVAVVDADGQATGIDRAHRWLPALGPGIEFADEVPATAECVDRVFIGSPAVRELTNRSSLRGDGRSVVVDEGLGSYGNAGSRFRALRREGAGLAPAIARAAVRTVATALHPSWRWPTYRRDAAGWTLNPSVAETFRAVAEPPAPSDDIVLLAQPWNELGLATGDDVRRAVDTIARTVADDGRRLVVRPHPRERLHPYGDVETLDHDLPAELQARVRGARLVIGDTSSALLHLATMFGVPTLRVRGISTADRLSATQSSLLTDQLGPAVSITDLAAALPRDPGAR